MRTVRFIIGLGFVAAWAAGCGPDCQSTCNKLYQTEQCGIVSPGQTQSELLSTCLDSCESALGTPGEVGDYDPNEYTPASVSVELQNDKQAAVWMDCVAETSCCLLGAGNECSSDNATPGYCAPVW